MLDRKLFDDFVPMPDLEAALADRSHAFRDHVFPASAMSMDAATGNLVTRNGTSTMHPLQDQAIVLLAQKLGIPVTYLRRCPSALAAENVNHWLRTLGGKPLLVRFDGEEVRAILTDRYVPVDNLVLIRALAAGSGDHRVRFEWTPTRFVCQVVSERHGATVRGERFLGGLHLVNSEVGFASVAIEALFLRLVCSNGMVVEDRTVTMKRVHRSSPERLYGAIREAIGAVDTLMPRLSIATARAVDEDADLGDNGLEQLLGDAGLGETVIEAVAEELANEPNQRSRFALVNAMTAVANRAAFSLADREVLQRLGGRLLVGARS